MNIAGNADLALVKELMQREIITGLASKLPG